jgi:hypothetical protein
MWTGSTPGHSAKIFQSSSAIRTGLKFTFILAMRCYGNYPMRNQRLLREAEICEDRDHLSCANFRRPQWWPFRFGLNIGYARGKFEPVPSDRKDCMIELECLRCLHALKLPYHHLPVRGVRKMSPVIRSEGYAERMAILEDLGVQEKALVQDDGLDEVTVADDDQAKKEFYARAFQEWAEGNVEGTAQEIFDGVTMLIEAEWFPSAALTQVGRSR